MTVRVPPEWAPHDAVWIGFPSDPGLWEENLSPAQGEVAAFANAVAAEGAGEMVRLVAADAEAAEAAVALAAPGVIVETAAFGDIWLRDTGPIIAIEDGAPVALDFGFNGWGGKYELPHDGTIGARLAQAAGFDRRPRDWVFEGGAIDIDGTGLVVTTEQCLLNPNRNGALDRRAIEARFAGDLGLTRVLWLGEGLLNDHTDGHVDNLARFVGPNRLALPQADGADDPNAAVFADAAARARDFGVEVVPMPSPGRVERDGGIVPASYMNFYIGNAAVIVPLYGAANDAAAVAAIAEMFPGHRVIGLRADHVLTGGGSFHCISQQVPSV